MTPSTRIQPDADSTCFGTRIPATCKDAHDLRRGRAPTLEPRTCSATPVGWVEVATRHDLAALEERLELRMDRLGSDLRAELERGLRSQLLAFLSANTVLLGLAVRFSRLLG